MANSPGTLTPRKSQRYDGGVRSRLALPLHARTAHSIMPIRQLPVMTNGSGAFFKSSARSLALLLAFALLLVACEEERPEPTEPDGAFKLFQESLEQNDREALWEYLDQETKDLFTQHYRALVRMDKIIETYFDPSEHRYLRDRTGAFLLKEANIDSPEALYRYTLNPSTIEFGDDEAVGAEIDELVYSDEEQTIAQIKTDANQSFVFIKEQDGIWRTASLRNIVEEALKPIANGEEAMKEFARENLVAERERRLEVIEYFAGRVEEGEGRSVELPESPRELLPEESEVDGEGSGDGE